MSSARSAIGAGVLALTLAFAATAQELVSIDIGDAVDTPGHRQLALEAARQGLVLVKNDDGGSRAAGA